MRIEFIKCLKHNYDFDQSTRSVYIRFTFDYYINIQNTVMMDKSVGKRACIIPQIYIELAC